MRRKNCPHRNVWKDIHGFWLLFYKKLSKVPLATKKFANFRKKKFLSYRHKSGKNLSHCCDNDRQFPILFLKTGQKFWIFGSQLSCLLLNSLSKDGLYFEIPHILSELRAKEWHTSIAWIANQIQFLEKWLEILSFCFTKSFRKCPWLKKACKY